MPPGTHDESERQTRKNRVDPLLVQQGWKVVPFAPERALADYANHAITEYPTDNGPADYAFVVDGQILGIAEAKKLTPSELQGSTFTIVLPVAES